MASLQHHPFAVEAHFERVVAVSFGFPEEVLRPLVGGLLELDSHAGLGFVTVALVWTRRLRPAGFPAVLGQDFFLAGYRIFTRLRDESGRRLRGLKILRSETDRRRMTWSGNLLTQYNYHHVRVDVGTQGERTRVETRRSDGSLSLCLDFSAPDGEVPLPVGSPFPDWRAARRFAGPMPFTFSPLDDGRVVVVEGSRTTWVPRPLVVHSWQVGLFAAGPLAGATPVLANAFGVGALDYRWEKGRLVKPSMPA